MSGADWLIIVLLLGLVGAGAYVMGLKKSGALPPPGPKSDGAPAGVPEADPDAKAKRAREQAEADAREDAEADAREEAETRALAERKQKERAEAKAKADAEAKKELAQLVEANAKAPTAVTDDSTPPPPKALHSSVPPDSGAKPPTKAPGPPGASKAASKDEAPKNEASTSDAPKKDDDVIPNLWAEDDEDIDPTKIGNLLAAPRKVIQPPVELIVVDEAAHNEDPPASEKDPLLLLVATAQTDTGLRRKRNEDSLLVNEKANLFVVADGMGGHRGGELASKLAVSTLEDAFLTGAIEGRAHESLPSEASELARAVQMANAAILEGARKRPELEGMGTTVCAARFSSTRRRMQIAHVGDSRCYRMRKGVFTQLTKDHTMAEHGVTGPESAHLSRAVGIWPTIPIDVLLVAPQPDDLYLVCSDGLTKMLTDDIVANVLRGEDDPKAAVERLILFSNARGGKDNITVILVRVHAPAAATPPKMVST